jgi:hypothetical protein
MFLANYGEPPSGRYPSLRIGVPDDQNAPDTGNIVLCERCKQPCLSQWQSLC